MSDADRVVVVGLGPVGAVTALLLAKAGVETLVLERAAGISPHGRAIALDDEALRVLQAAGISEADLRERPAELPVSLRSRHGESLLELQVRDSAAGHPSLVFFHQPDLEHQLRSALRRQPNVEVLLQHEVERCEQGADAIAVTARNLCDGTSKHFGARWVLACDGASSRLRREAGIPLRGLTSGHRWLVVDALIRGRPAKPSFQFLCDPNRPTVSAALPGGRQRWEFMLLPGEDADDLEEWTSVRRLVSRHAALENVDLLRASVYTFHARVAERWRKGRLLLAGDAAHLSPPFAGQGLSIGLRDAHNLAWKLAAVMQQRATPALLSSYEAERRPHAIRLISLALALGGLVQITNHAGAASRDVALRTLLASPSVRRRVTTGGWKPASRYRRGLVSQRRARRKVGGSQFPQSNVVLADGSEQPLDDVLGTHFGLIGWETDPATNLDPAARATLTALPATLVHVRSSVVARPNCGSGVIAVADNSGMLAGWFDSADAEVALVRPDRHVYAAFHTAEAGEVLRELAHDLDPRALHQGQIAKLDCDG